MIKPLVTFKLRKTKPMKNYLLIIAAIALASCEKETPEPVIPTPVHMENYFMLNGIEYPINNSDTASYTAPLDVTGFQSEAQNRLMVLSFPGNDTINYHYSANQQGVFFAVQVNGEFYSRPDVNLHVTEYGPVGGRIVGSFEGTVKQNSDTSVVLPVSGAFNVLRGPDIQ